jgi:hypothetical protein
MARILKTDGVDAAVLHRDRWLLHDVVADGRATYPEHTGQLHHQCYQHNSGKQVSSRSLSAQRLFDFNSRN